MSNEQFANGRDTSLRRNTIVDSGGEPVVILSAELQAKFGRHRQSIDIALASMTLEAVRELVREIEDEITNPE
jgi:hypothetical protein